MSQPRSIGSSLVFAFLFAIQSAFAATPAALTGQVSSAEEGFMEGVLVTARKAESNMNVTVVSDAKGRFEFPARYLDPGHYAITVRAAGYDLASPASVDVTGSGPASASLKLVRTKDMAAQLTNGEWLYSAPGTDDKKRPLLGCVGCHQLSKITMSKYDTEGFVQTIQRMGTYANQSTFIRPQKRLTGRDTDLVGEDRAKLTKSQAEYFATINQSSRGSGWTYDLKAFPRPTGRGTRVVITEWDLPRPTMQPHDVIVDASGIAWYCDFGDQKIGTLDPKTGKVTEISLPELKKGSPNGSLSARFDRDGNIWIGMMYQAAIGKYDVKAGKLQTWVAPQEWNRPNTQINMTSPLNIGVDGKIWAQNNGFAGVHRIDLKTGQWETWEPYKASPRGHNIYDVISDSKNNGWFTDIGRETIGRIDANTGEIKLYSTPTKASGPRRGMMDSQDRIWFAQYRGNRIAMFDTNTEQFKEWQVPTPWTQPYDVAIDRNAEAWTGSMLNDRIVRLDTKSGRMVEYLLPRFTNIRRVFVDNSTNPVSFWVGSNHGASIIRVEPLD
jgi:streptogramin lyase